jgi:hypothetical protein
VEKYLRRGRPQITIWRMRIRRWITKATNTHTACTILTNCPVQQLLHDHTSMLRYTYISCLVTYYKVLSCKQLSTTFVVVSFGPKGDEVTGEWIKLHNEELNNLYPSPTIVGGD